MVENLRQKKLWIYSIIRYVPFADWGRKLHPIEKAKNMDARNVRIGLMTKYDNICRYGYCLRKRGVKMKKFLMSFILMLFMVVPNFVHAEYPDLLNEDRNVVICGGHMGYGMYLVRNSIQIVNYNDNGIILAFDTISVSNADREDRTIGNRTKSTYLYKKNECAMYWLSESDDKWHYVKPVGSMAETGHYYPGELAYCFAFGKPYYSGRQWYDSALGRYTDAACSWVYGIYKKYR